MNGKVKAIYYNREFLQSTKDIPEDTLFGLILDRTNFYAESGGQEYDTGTIVIEDKAEFEVVNVQSFSGYILHIGRLKSGELGIDNEVVATYDEVRSPSRL